MAQENAMRDVSGVSARISEQQLAADCHRPVNGMRHTNKNENHLQ